MKTTILGPALVLIAIAPFSAAADPDQPFNPDNKSKGQIAQVQKLLDETFIETKGLPKNPSLAKLLNAVDAQLPKAKKGLLRLDERGLGKDFSKVAEFSIALPKGSRKLSLNTLLQLILGQVVEQVEVDCGFETAGVVLTRPSLATSLVVYPVRDIVDQMPLLLPEMERGLCDLVPPGIFQNIKPTDGPALLVRLLVRSLNPRPWETIQVLNGSRLAVRANPIRQGEFVSLIEALRRASDVAVVMNARLYEVDRAFFAAHLAPLFSGHKDSEPPPSVVAIDGPLLKKVTKNKSFLESDEVKLSRNREAPFLSLQKVLCFAGRPQPGKSASGKTGTALSGVSFLVRPRVSPDRRFLRLEITQNVSQLIGIDKARVIDTPTGKEVEYDVPNLRRVSLTGTVQIADGNPIVMPVDYAPDGAGKADKVWLLVARPFIWIDEEVKELRKEGHDLSSKGIWDSAVYEDQKPSPAKRLPLNEDVKQILQAIITDVLTCPELKTTREFYGTAEDKTFSLLDDNLGWPEGFKPETHGYKQVEVKPDPFINGRRILGIRLDKFELQKKTSDPLSVPIEVCLCNAGGSANGGVIGGCSVYYVPKRTGKRWTVEYQGLLDP